jgi:hypothetical protein
LSKSVLASSRAVGFLQPGDHVDRAVGVRGHELEERADAVAAVLEVAARLGQTRAAEVDLGPDIVVVVRRLGRVKEIERSCLTRIARSR